MENRSVKSERTLRCVVRGCWERFPSPGTLRLHARRVHGISLLPLHPDRTGQRTVDHDPALAPLPEGVKRKLTVKPKRGLVQREGD